MEQEVVNMEENLIMEREVVNMEGECNNGA
ncbi:MAG: hypothetical protein K0S76_2314 [Herbinix sp.]|jgi:hypothetical protein|nr:hypothetical protein [Herbinix sp.]